MKGISKHVIDDYLTEFNFFERCTNVFEDVLRELKVI
jgi:hypothetical protein